MRTLLYLTIILLVTLCACSKYNGPSPKTTPTVTINGTVYSTVTVRNQTWTRENYTSADTVSLNDYKFYTYAQALAIPLPSGWRVPTQTDFNNLLSAAGGTMDGEGVIPNAHALTLMAKIGWTVNFGTDSLGFNTTGVGYALSGPPLSYEGYQTDDVFWCSTMSNGINQYGSYQVLIIQQLKGDPQSAFPATVQLIPFAQLDYASVRFVKDN